MPKRCMLCGKLSILQEINGLPSGSKTYIMKMFFQFYRRLTLTKIYIPRVHIHVLSILQEINTKVFIPALTNYLTLSILQEINREIELQLERTKNENFQFYRRLTKFKSFELKISLDALSILQEINQQARPPDISDEAEDFQFYRRLTTLSLCISRG